MNKLSVYLSYSSVPLSYPVAAHSPSLRTPLAIRTALAICPARTSSRQSRTDFAVRTNRSTNLPIMNLRQQLTQFLTMAFVFSSSFMAWKTLSVVTNSHSPVVVVLSGSMEPAFQRGDILFLWNRQRQNKVGDVVVYEIKGKDIPIVHRVLREHHNLEKQYLLTKGDNNLVDDLGLYAKKQGYLNQATDLVGTVKAYLPKVGYVTILISENMYARYALLGIMCISSLLTGE